MLTPEQVAEIRKQVAGIRSITISCAILDLLDDRAQIAQELDIIKQNVDMGISSGRPGLMIGSAKALTALIERIK